MRVEHLQMWSREAREAEAAAGSESETAGEMVGGIATGLEMETEAAEMKAEETTEMMETEMSHWQKVVDLAQAAFQEGRLS